MILMSTNDRIDEFGRDENKIERKWQVKFGV